MEDLGPRAVDEMLQSSRQLLGAMRRGDAPAPDDEPVVITADAADGLVRVVAGAGRIERIELDPRAMRLDSQTLAEELTTAVNAALAGLRDAAGTARSVDPEALDRQLREAQDEGVRRMADISAALQGVLARIHQDRR